MPKEGEGIVKKSELREATGQGKETEGIKYPSPSLNILAVIEEEFGSLVELGETLKNPKNPYLINSIRSLVFIMEMQKDGKEEEISLMTKEERRNASIKFIAQKGITLENFPEYIKAFQAVFSRAPGRVVKKK